MFDLLHNLHELNAQKLSYNFDELPESVLDLLSSVTLVLYLLFRYKKRGVRLLFKLLIGCVLKKLNFDFNIIVFTIFFELS